MTNYDMDEMRRKKSEFGKDMIEHEKQLGKEEEPWTTIDIEIKDEDFMKVAQEAQRKDITFNKMINIILKKSINDAKYRFEHESNPQLLNETK